MPVLFVSQHLPKLSAEFKRALLGVHHLSSLPSVALRLIELAQAPETDLASVADTIALDIALSTRLLRIANLPLYASSGHIDKLSQALTLLGLNTSVQLSLDFVLPEVGNDQNSENYALQQRVWSRSLLAAQAARLLGNACGEYRSEELGLAALLQDMGILVWLQIQPDRYQPLFQVMTDNAALLHAEREHWGFTHADLGAHVAAQWHLPAYLVRAIAHSESLAHVSSHFEYCVALSGLLADLVLADEHINPSTRRRWLAQLQDGLGNGLGLDEAVSEQIILSLEEIVPDLRGLLVVSLPQPLDALQIQANELKQLRHLRELHALSIRPCCDHPIDKALWCYTPEQQSA